MKHGREGARQRNRVACGRRLAGMRDRIADVLDAAEHRGELHEFGFGTLGEHARERGLTGAWRPPQHHRMQRSLIERPAQGLAGTEQVRLAVKIGQRRGS